MGRASLKRVAILAVFAGVMLTTSLALATPTSLVSETPINTSPSTSFHSDVYEGKVVYNEIRSVDGGINYDVWLYDLATGLRKAIAFSNLGEYRPRIWGDYVVYNRDQASVNLYRISTGKTTTIAEKYAQSTVVDIYRDKVVYSKFSPVTKTNDVYLYDIATGKETKIISSVVAGKYADDRVQSLWGDNVVYVVNYKDIRVYNLATKKSVSLNATGYAIDGDAANAGPNRPEIYQNTIVYPAIAQGNMQIFTYDLASHLRTQVSQDATNNAVPVIHGSRIVYEYGSLANKELVAYDIRTKSSWKLNIGHAMEPAVWGDRLSWTDLRHGVADDEHDDGADWSGKDLYTGTFNTIKFVVSDSLVVPYATPTQIRAEATDPDGSSPATGTVVGLEISSNGIAWSNVGTATTTGGAVSVTMPPIPDKRYARFTYDGTAEVPSTTSLVFTVKPQAAVGAPVAPATMKEDKSYSIYGSLRPQHSSGVVRIYLRKKVSGVWRPFGYTNAHVYKYGSYSRYRADVKLTSKGEWRMRAYENADAKHAEAWSSYTYVTVK